jgi:glycosyltransferase involved in cell wall biosynthesis
MLDHDIIICNDFPPSAMVAFPWRTLILDYYTIFYVEWMENTRDQLKGSTAKRTAWMSGARRRIGAQMISADLITCANDRQKDYYIGAMIALGLINPEAYDRDPAMKQLVATASHGVRSDPLVPGETRAIKGVYGGIKDTDHLIMWNGGILQWYDPLTLLHAMAKIKEHRDDVKLVFVGGAYPGLGGMGLGKRFQQTVELARELNLYNNTVFFELAWVPYDKIKDYMLESDLAVCTYFDNMETHFSLRTRFVDVFWAELPLICTQGDVFADMVRERGMGITVPQSDVPALTEAIERLIDDTEFREQCRRNIREVNEELRWERTMQPFVDFCRNPQSSTIAKWRRVPLANLAWAQWVVHRAIGMWIR